MSELTTNGVGASSLYAPCVNRGKERNRDAMTTRLSCNDEAQFHYSVWEVNESNQTEAERWKEKKKKTQRCEVPSPLNASHQHNECAWIDGLLPTSVSRKTIVATHICNTRSTVDNRSEHLIDDLTVATEAMLASARHQALQELFRPNRA
jgi:hypothetical protein